MSNSICNESDASVTFPEDFNDDSRNDNRGNMRNEGDSVNVRLEQLNDLTSVFHDELQRSSTNTPIDLIRSDQMNDLTSVFHEDLQRSSSNTPIPIQTEATQLSYNVTELFNAPIYPRRLSLQGGEMHTHPQHYRQEFYPHPQHRQELAHNFDRGVDRDYGPYGRAFPGPIPSGYDFYQQQHLLQQAINPAHSNFFAMSNYHQSNINHPPNYHEDFLPRNNFPHDARTMTIQSRDDRFLGESSLARENFGMNPPRTTQTQEQDLIPSAPHEHLSRHYFFTRQLGHVPRFDDDYNRMPFVPADEPVRMTGDLSIHAGTTKSSMAPSTENSEDTNPKKVEASQPKPPREEPKSVAKNGREGRKTNEVMDDSLQSRGRPTNEEMDDSLSSKESKSTHATNILESCPLPTEEAEESVWVERLQDSAFVDFKHRGLVSDVLLYAMAQMKPCGLTRDDRIGKYKTREIGFVGMCCKHCGGQPGFGRYFPSSFDSFLNGKNCDGIIKHVKTECRVCPDHIKTTIQDLESQEKKDKNRPPHGSRKLFFNHIWTKLRSMSLDEACNESMGEIQNESLQSREETKSTSQASISGNDASKPNLHIQDFNGVPWQEVIGESEIVSVEDRHLVPDTLLIAFAQMKRCKLEDTDRVGRCKTHQVGFNGMCCKHCGGRSGKPGFGRYFPSSLRSLAQVDSCQQVVRHIASKCTHCPPRIRKVIQDIMNLEQSDRIRYGSRAMFYRRVWSRLHGGTSETEPDTSISMHTESEIAQDRHEMEEVDEEEKKSDDEDSIPWNEIIDNSQIVSTSDRKLVPASEVAALAQMVPCRLTSKDQVGWFKNRPVGSGGLACKHCGGRPSYGRYFPKSARSFAQTTCGQTIMTHVTLYCKNVPESIREAIAKLQRMEGSDQGMSSTGVQSHGSRKVFYDRLWQRLQRPNNESDKKKQDTRRKNEGDEKISTSYSTREMVSTDLVARKEDVKTSKAQVRDKGIRPDAKKISQESSSSMNGKRSSKRSLNPDSSAKNESPTKRNQPRNTAARNNAK